MKHHKSLCVLLTILLMAATSCASLSIGDEEIAFEESTIASSDEPLHDVVEEVDELIEEDPSLDDDELIRASFAECDYELDIYEKYIYAGPIREWNYSDLMPSQRVYSFSRESFENKFSIALPNFGNRVYRDREQYMYRSVIEQWTELDVETLAIFSFQCFPELPSDFAYEEIVLEDRQWSYVEYAYLMNDEYEFMQLSAWTELQEDSWLVVYFSFPEDDYETWTVLMKSVLASVKDEEETLQPKIQRELDVWYELGRTELTLYSLDLSPAPSDREWKKERFKLNHLITANELLWVMRGETEYVGLPEMGTIAVETDEDLEYSRVYRIQITDSEFEGTYEYYNNLCKTLIHALKQHGIDTSTLHNANFAVLKNGEQIPDLPYYAGTNYFEFSGIERGNTGIYTPEELREIRERVPYSSERLDGGRTFPYLHNGEIKLYAEDWPMDEESWNSMSALDRDISKFISAVLPNGYIDYQEISFDHPAAAPEEFIRRSVMRCAPVMIWENTADEQPSGEFDILGRFAGGNGTGVLENHVDQTAKRIYGDAMVLTHRSLEGKTWFYNRYAGLYTHFPGGTGDGYLFLGDYPLVLSYVDLGDSYSVTIALAESLSAYLVELDDKRIGQEMTQTILDESPRAVVTLKKLDGNRFHLWGLEYLGYPE